MLSLFVSSKSFSDIDTQWRRSLTTAIASSMNCLCSPREYQVSLMRLAVLRGMFFILTSGAKHTAFDGPRPADDTLVFLL